MEGRDLLRSAIGAILAAVIAVSCGETAGAGPIKAESATAELAHEPLLSPSIHSSTSRTTLADLPIEIPATGDQPEHLFRAIERAARREAERFADSLVATPFAQQDSSMLVPLAAADCLVIRAPHAPAAEAGTPCAFVPLHD